MVNEVIQKKQIFSVLAVFLLGNLIIAFPKGEGLEQSFWGYIICFAVSILMGFWVSNLQCNNKDFGVEYFASLTGIKSILKWLLVILCLGCLAWCCKDYVSMVDSIRLPKTPRVIISVIYVIVVVLLSLAKKKVILMFAFTNLIFISFAVVIMLLFSIPLFRLEYFINSLDFNFKNVITQGLTFYIHSFGQTFLCLLFIGYIKKEYAVKGTFYGILIGGTVFLICFLNIVFMVSRAVVPKLSFPYANVTGMLVIGENYNRLDAITYYIYFICNLIKASVLFKIIGECFKNKGKICVLIFSSVLTVAFSGFEKLGRVLHGDALNLTLLILEIFFPITLTIMFRLKKIKRNPKI